MGETTKIEWTDHTFNPWRGCSKVHLGCTNCYAERDARRFPDRLGVWGQSGTRVVAAESMWREPVKWNKAAEQAGERRRVFCASLADVFESWGGGHVSGPDGRVWVKPYLDRESQPENWQLEDEETMRQDPQGWRFVTLDDVRARLFALIDATPHLDWLLLTKRPENVRRMWPMLETKRTIFPGMPGAMGQPQRCFVENANRPSVWIGTSISNQATADKYVPELLKLRDLTPCLFLSVEPLVGPVDLSQLLPHWFYECHVCGASGESPWRPGNPCGAEPAEGFESEDECNGNLHVTRGTGIDWVIVGGESGPKARPCDVAWIRSIVQQCKAADVPCFVKQVGAITVDSAMSEPDGTPGIWLGIRDKKGGDPSEWPEDLRVREFPEIEVAL